MYGLGSDFAFVWAGVFRGDAPAMRVGGRLASALTTIGEYDNGYSN